MKKLTLVLMAVVTVCSSANAQMPGTKPGLWETKLVHQVVDGRDMTEKLAAAQAKMQAAMAQMTPEQRQQMASMMKGMPGQGQNGGMRVCISPAMAASHSMTDPNNHCPSTSINTSGNKTTYSFNCTKDGRTIVGTGQNIANGDVVSSHLETKSTDAKGSHTMVIDSEMTYLGSDCQGVAPMDQMLKGMEASGK
jgi:hypothetical protein